MKKWFSILLIGTFLAACSLNASPPSLATNAPPPDTTQAGIPYPQPETFTKGYPLPSSENGYPLSTEQASNPAYPAPQIVMMQPETRFGVAAVDRVLDALFKNPDQLNALVVYTQAPCTLAEGLGGPPKCEAGQAEGTVVTVLPVLGSEGHFIPKGGQKIGDILGNVELLGVFQVVEGYQSEMYYPVGAYGIVLRQAGTAAIIVLRVTADGIVRIDFPVQIPGKEQVDLDRYLEPLT